MNTDSKFETMSNNLKQFAKENPKTTKVAAVAAAAAAGVVFAPVLTVVALTGYFGWKLTKPNDPKLPGQ